MGADETADDLLVSDKWWRVVRLSTSGMLALLLLLPRACEGRLQTQPSLSLPVTAEAQRILLQLHPLRATTHAVSNSLRRLEEAAFESARGRGNEAAVHSVQALLTLSDALDVGGAQAAAVLDALARLVDAGALWCVPPHQEAAACQALANSALRHLVAASGTAASRSAPVAGGETESRRAALGVLEAMLRSSVAVAGPAGADAPRDDAAAKCMLIAWRSLAGPYAQGALAPWLAREVLRILSDAQCRIVHPLVVGGTSAARVATEAAAGAERDAPAAADDGVDQLAGGAHITSLVGAWAAELEALLLSDAQPQAALLGLRLIRSLLGSGSAAGRDWQGDETGGSIALRAMAAAAERGGEVN